MFSTVIHTLLFYGLALAVVCFAVGVVVTRHIFRAAVFLMVVLLLSAGFYLLLKAEFLAGVQVLVYVGGIVVLLAFAVMLTSSAELLEHRPSTSRRLLGFAVAALFFILTAATFMASGFPVQTRAGESANNTASIGKALLDRGSQGYVLPFEIISLLLLAAAIGGIVVARKTPAAPAKRGAE